MKFLYTEPVRLTNNVTVEIITIGDEILFGQIVDTNTQWMSNTLAAHGFRTVRKSSVGDVYGHILSILKEAKSRAQIVLLTGGLGPTKDDITKEALCEFFDSGLVINEDALRFITSFFEKRGRPMTELNRLQAAVPSVCTYLPNRWGTAPGMWFEQDEVVFVSLPGVPFEMKNLMEQEVIPRLLSRFNPPTLIHRMIKTVGIGESFLAERIAEWEDQLPESIRLAYLPHFGQVKLRLTATGEDSKALNAVLDHQISRLKPLIAPYIFGYGEDELEDVIGKYLQAKNATLATAESCTGGKIAHKITSVPGSSAYFQGSAVTYSNQSKISLLEVLSDTLEKYGAVSEQTVIQMAENVKRVFGSDYGLATSGVAGPGGGTVEKPVGTVWIACSGPSGTQTQLLKLGRYRQQNIELATTYALALLFKNLSN